jgi:hypothetical protein
MPPAINPGQLEVRRYRQLASLCWFRRDETIPEEEAYSLDVENWAFVDQAAMSENDRDLVTVLNTRHGNLLRIYTPSSESPCAA